MPHLRARDGVRLHYVTFGDPEAPPLVLLHGLGADNVGWIRQRSAFGRHFHCIALDNRGSGRSEAPYGAYELATMASDAVEVADELGLERFHLLGASMGGAISQYVAVEYPERVDRLVLACTACRMKDWRRDLLTAWIEQAEEQGVRHVMASNLRWLVGPRSLRRLWPAASVFGLLAQRAPAHGLVGQLHALLATEHHHLHRRLAEITAPTLVIVGSQDLLTPVADSEEIAGLVPDATLAVLRGAAHGFMVEQAGAFNRTVLDFLTLPPVTRGQTPRYRTLASAREPV